MNGKGPFSEPFNPCGGPLSSETGYWLYTNSGVYKWFTSRNKAESHIVSTCGVGLYKVNRLCKDCGEKYGLEW